MENNNKMLCSKYIFKSRLHNIYTELINKLALTAEDDKRFKLYQSYDTLASGHKDIPFFKFVYDIDE